MDPTRSREINMREKLFYMMANLCSRGFEDRIQQGESRYSKQEIECLQFKKFIKLYRYAFGHIPFYKKKYERAGLSLSSLSCYADIKRVPCLSRQELIEQQELLHRRQGVTFLESGGTTGARVHTQLNKSIAVKRYEMLLQILYRVGWQISMPSAAFYSNEYRYSTNFFPLLRRGQLNKLIFDFIQQYVIYGFFHNRKNIYFGSELFVQNNADRYLRPVWNKKPVLLIARPDVITVLIKQGKIKGVDFRPIKSIVTVGNMLTESTRSLIEEVFSATVYNMYASTELGYIGVSCPGSGVSVHVDDENYIVEVADNDQNEIVVTDFNNYMLPLIRYKSSDVGEYAPRKCFCGRSGQVLCLRGRTRRFILSDTENKIYEYDVIEFFEQFKDIINYQIVRRPDQQLSMNIGGGQSKGDKDQILVDFCDSFKIDPRRVLLESDGELIRSPSGKVCCLV